MPVMTLLFVKVKALLYAIDAVTAYCPVTVNCEAPEAVSIVFQLVAPLQVQLIEPLFTYVTAII